MPGLHAEFLFISECPQGLTCPWVPKHHGGIGWNQIPLCLPHLCWTEVYNLDQMGSSRPEDAFAGAAECWSLEHIYCASYGAGATVYSLADNACQGLQKSWQQIWPNCLMCRKMDSHTANHMHSTIFVESSEPAHSAIHTLQNWIC